MHTMLLNTIHNVWNVHDIERKKDSPVMDVHWALSEDKINKLVSVKRVYYLKVHRAESANSWRNTHMWALIQTQQ